MKKIGEKEGGRRRKAHRRSIESVFRKNNNTPKLLSDRPTSCNGPGPLNITFGSDMPITLLHLMLTSKIYLVNSDMKNVIGMSDPNVMFKGPGPFA